MNENIQPCRCGSKHSKLSQRLEVVDGETKGFAKIVCQDCSFTLNFPMADPKNKKKQPLRILDELMGMWNKIMVDEKLEKQLEASLALYLREEMIGTLTALSETIRQAEESGHGFPESSRQKLLSAVKKMQKVREAIHGVEVSCEKLFKEIKTSVGENIIPIKGNSIISSRVSA